MAVELSVAAHPLLALSAFVAEFAAPLADCPSPEWLRAAFGGEPSAASGASLEPPWTAGPADDAVRKTVRDLLRHGGFRPSGRSKPASEFLLRAARRGELGSINLAVDLCNAASLYSGLPISVVDLDRLVGAPRAAIVEDGEYVFNASGQVIRLDGLLCLQDAEGPCANPVKDSQRTKTHGGTRKTLCVVWGAAALQGRSAAATAWYGAMHERSGATLRPVALG